MAASGADAVPGDTIGDALIPVINRLQDIFSQVRGGSESGVGFEYVQLHVRRCCATRCGSVKCLGARQQADLAVRFLRKGACRTLWRRPSRAPAFPQATVDLKLTLPQVVVIGSQSAGKSSVLEALVSQGGRSRPRCRSCALHSTGSFGARKTSTTQHSRLAPPRQLQRGTGGCRPRHWRHACPRLVPPSCPACSVLSPARCLMTRSSTPPHLSRGPK